MLVAISFAIGVLVGNLLNLIADRMPVGRSPLGLKFCCRHCGVILSCAAFTSVFNYLRLQGNCSHCGSRIPIRGLLVEVIIGVVFVLVYLRFGYGLHFVVAGTGISILSLIAIVDLEHKVILNSIVLPILLALFIASPFWNQVEVARPFLGNTDWFASLANSATAGLGTLFFFKMVSLAYPNGIGGGDIKLACMLGFLVGFPSILLSLWVTLMAVTVLAIVLPIWRTEGMSDLIPFGPFLSIGGIVVLLLGNDVVANILHI